MGLIEQREGLSEQGSSEALEVSSSGEAGAFFVGRVKQLGGCERQRLGGVQRAGACSH